MKAHVSDKKKKEVNSIIDLFRKYKTISIGDLTGLPSKQLQNIRNRMKNILLIKTSKKRLIKLAIKNFKDKDLSGLNNCLDKIMPVLLLSNDNSFKIYRQLKKNRVNVTAKPGQIAPYDLEIKAGPTNFTPGPIIGELGQVGLVAAVEGGKIIIKRDKIIAAKGDIISGKVADILSKMGIEPMEVKLNMVASYEDGMVYGEDILDLDEEKLLEDIKTAHIYAINLAVKAVYPCDEIIKKLIAKASLEAKALDSKIDLGGIKGKKFAEEPKEEFDAKEFEQEGEAERKKTDEEVAKEVLAKIKDDDIKKREASEKEAKRKKEQEVPDIYDLVKEKAKKEG